VYSTNIINGYIGYTYVLSWWLHVSTHSITITFTFNLNNVCTYMLYLYIYNFIGITKLDLIVIHLNIASPIASLRNPVSGCVQRDVFY